MVLNTFSSGTKAKASEVNENINQILTGQIIANLNLRAIGHSATDGVTENNFVYDLDTDTTTKVDTANTDWVCNSNWQIGAFTGIVYDNYADASIDTTKWTITDPTTDKVEVARTNTNPTYSDGYVGIATANDVTGARTWIISTNAASGLNMKTASNITQCAFKTFTQMNNAHLADTFTITLRISDGTHTATVDSYVFTDDGQATNYYVFTFNASTTTLSWTKNGVAQSNVNLASVTGNWYIELVGVSNAPVDANTYNLWVYPIYYTNASTNLTASEDFISTATTIETSDTAIGYFNSAGNGLAYSVSLDGGSNYTAVTNKVLTSIAQSGTSIKVKASTTAVTSSYLPQIKSYGVIYG